MLLPSCHAALTQGLPGARSFWRTWGLFEQPPAPKNNDDLQTRSATAVTAGSAHEQDALLEVLGHAQRERAPVQGLAVVDDLDVAPAGQMASLILCYLSAILLVLCS